MTVHSSFTLLNTRPVHQAEALSRGVRAMNGEVLNCPTIEIQWVGEASISQAFSQIPEQIDKIIFTSVNAVQGFVKSPFCQNMLLALTAKPSQTYFYAIGKATKLKGLEAGLPLKTLSQISFDSESLLEHPTMKAVKGESILIIKGQAGRSLMMDSFQERGARVSALDVYKRVAAPLCIKSWLKFTQSIHPILLITSVESFESLCSALITFDAHYGNMDDPIWSFLHNTIVFSQRIKQHLRARGWQPKISVVVQQSNDGTLQCITQSLSTTS